MYATETDNFNNTEFDKMMFMQSFSDDGVIKGIISLIFAVLAALDPSYPAATSSLVGTLAAHARIWQAFKVWRLLYHKLHVLSCHLSQNQTTQYSSLWCHSKQDFHPQLLLKT